MKAVVFHDVGDIRLDDAPDPRLPQPTAHPPQIRRESGWTKVELEPAA